MIKFVKRVLAGAEAAIKNSDEAYRKLILEETEFEKLPEVGIGLQGRVSGRAVHVPLQSCAASLNKLKLKIIFDES